MAFNEVMAGLVPATHVVSFGANKTWMSRSKASEATLFFERLCPGMTWRGVALLAALVFAVAPARAESVEEFYRGKSITLVIGYSVGGGYDLYGRLLARHLGKYIPGQPSVVPQTARVPAVCAPPSISTAPPRRTAR